MRKPKVTSAAIRSKDHLIQTQADAEGLMRWAESSERHAVVNAQGRTRPLVFHEAIHKRVVARLNHAVERGSGLYLQGSVLGVGASVLTREYARQFTEYRRSQGLPDQIVTVRLSRATKSHRNLLSAIAHALKIKVSAWELTFGDKTAIGEAIAAEVRRGRVRAVIFDHVSRAGPDAQGLIGEFMHAVNPLYSSSFEEDAEPFQPTAVILVDEQVPELVFRSMPDVLTALGGNYVELGRYETVEQVADALRKSEIGLGDLDLGSPADLDVAEAVREASDGLIANMDPLMELIDLTARSCQERPGLKHVKGALRYHRRMVDLAMDVDDDGVRTLALMAKHRSRRRVKDAGSDSVPPAGESQPKKTKKRRGGPSKAAIKAANTAIAKSERSDIQRKRGYTVLPGN